LTATCPSVVENEPALDTGCVPGRANEVGLDHHVVAAPFSEAETLESCPLAGIGFFRIRSTQRFVVPTNKDTGHNRLPRALLAGVGRAFACAVTFTVTISPQAGSTPASVILTDATQALPTATGQLGSGLGYIGIANGYLGIGVDTYGGLQWTTSSGEHLPARRDVDGQSVHRRHRSLSAHTFDSASATRPAGRGTRYRERYLRENNLGERRRHHKAQLSEFRFGSTRVPREGLRRVCSVIRRQHRLPSNCECDNHREPVITGIELRDAVSL
jgi:hypothetical protein